MTPGVKMIQYDSWADQSANSRSDSNLPVIPLPNPGEGGPVDSSSNDGQPVIPLPNPGEGGPVDSGTSNGGQPVIPLPTPGEGGPVDPGNSNGGQPVIPLPNPGEGGPVYPGGQPTFPFPGGIIVPILPRFAKVRFLNAAYGYRPFRILVNKVRASNYLGYAAVSSYGRVPVGYQTITVTGMDGYIYLQKNLPFRSGETMTIALINTASGLDLLQINDTCCAPNGNHSNFRVSNLAINCPPVDVLLGDGRVVYSDVHYKETTAYKRIRPGAYQFFFAETKLDPIPAWMDIETLDSAFIGTNPVPNTLASLYLNVVPNVNDTVYLIPSGPQTIQALLVENR